MGKVIRQKLPVWEVCSFDNGLNFKEVLFTGDQIHCGRYMQSNCRWDGKDWHHNDDYCWMRPQEKS